MAETALKLAHAVERGEGKKDPPQREISLNKDLIQAAALLHDIKRKEKNHAQAGSRLLKSFGFHLNPKKIDPKNCVMNRFITNKSK